MSRSPLRGARLAALLLATAILTTSAALVIAATPQTAWLDAPLDGSTVEAGDPVQIVGHVSHPDAIVAARILINGERLARAALDAEPGQLTTVEFEWEPAEPGTHVLALSARTADGWQQPALATVIVEGQEPPPTTTSPTTAPPTTAPPTTSPPTTSPPTTSPPTTQPPCEFAAPEPISPADGATTPLTANTLSWAYNGCKPALEFQIEVSTTPSFTEVFATGTVMGSTEWLTPNLACDTYYWRVRPKVFDTVGPWSAPWSYTISFRGC